VRQRTKTEHSALPLVEEKTLGRRKFPLLRQLVGAKGIAQGSQENGELDVLASRMRNEGRGPRLMIAGPVACQAIGHQDRWIDRLPPIEHLGEMLTGVTRPGLEKKRSGRAPCRRTEHG